MSDQELAERYEAAIRRFQDHLKRNDDGTFRIDADNARSIGIEPVLFSDLMRSLDETNRMIRSGEIDPKKIEYIR